MASIDLVTGKVIEYLEEKTLDASRDFFNKCRKEGVLIIEKKDLPNIFSNHYKEVINWSSDIPFIGLNKNKKVANSTIELSISTKISKYDKSSNKTDFYSEIELIKV